MNSRHFKILILIIILFQLSCTQNKFIEFNNPSIYYEGRIVYKEDAAEFSWPGTSATIWFEGSDISAVLQDLDTANYYNVIVDDKNISKIHTIMVKQRYVLASGLPLGIHKVQLFKRTEWDKGKTLFYGFETGAYTKILPVQSAKKRMIEFYGNSITCGYAMEDNSGGDSWHGYFENNYLSYAAITARYFSAQYSCIAKSGIGITISWFPLIMSEMYDRLDPADSTSKWDFSKYNPDVVVINLFQNDSWLIEMPEHEQFKYRFGLKAPDKNYFVKSYKDFVASIRNKYPHADIVCTLGSMDATKEGSPWPGYIQNAAAELNDPKIFLHFFKYKNTDGHPKISEQRKMAESLIDFIEKNISW
jgi:hypothetical protein